MSFSPRIQGFAVLWSVGLLVFCREYLGAEPGRFRTAVTGAAYCSYLIHPVIVFGLTRLLTWPWWPVGGDMDLLLHILVMSPASILITWAVSLMIKLIPGSGRIL